MTQALEDIKVLDLSSYIAGPLTAQLLAEQGAEVIKVERPEGDPARKVPGFAVWNRSKKAIVLNLKTDLGRQAARELALGSDVVIENFKPGGAQRFGLDYETLSAENSRLVYCSIPAFGSEGPLKDKIGWEPIVQAYAVVHQDQGGPRGQGEPVWDVLPLASYYAAAEATYATNIALFVRELTGRGQKVEVSLWAAMLQAQCGNLVHFEGAFRAHGVVQQGLNPVYRLYQCSDGEWIFIACGNDRFWHNLALTLEHAEWISDPRFQSRFVFTPEAARELQAMLEAIFITRPSDEWIAQLMAAYVPCTVARTTEDFMNDPQVAANEMIVEVDDPVLFRTRQMGIPVKMQATPGSIKGPAPLLGQHSLEVLGASGYTAAEVAAMTAPAVYA